MASLDLGGYHGFSYVPGGLAFSPIVISSFQGASRHASMGLPELLKEFSF